MAAITIAACGPNLVNLRQASREFTPGDYEGIYGRWTRSADDFDFGRLGEVLHVTATFESWEFRWAYVVRFGHDHSYTTDERTRVLAETLGDAHLRHRFFVTLGSPVYRDADLTGVTSDIRVLLVDTSGRQVEPVEVVRIARPSADQRRYFPSIHRQRHTFRIAFPTVAPDGAPTIPPDATRVTLRFAAAAGTVNLEWDLADAPEPPPELDASAAELSDGATSGGEAETVEAPEGEPPAEASLTSSPAP